MSAIKLTQQARTQSNTGSSASGDSSSSIAISQPTPAPPLRVTRNGAAEYLGSLGFPISANRLAKLAVTGGGPEYHRWGGRVLYEPASLLQWAKEREKTVDRRGVGAGGSGGGTEVSIDVESSAGSRA